MKIKPLELIRFLFIAIPVFILVYCFLMTYVELKELVKKL